MNYADFIDSSHDFDYMAEPENNISYNRERELALQIVTQTGANLFLTGKAGTGKTTFLRDIQEMKSKRMAVLAPTGVAAINAHGVTIHSFFMLPLSPYIPGKGFVGEDTKYFRFSAEKKKLISSLDLLVIDEISMVRGDTLDAVDDLLRRLRGSNAPFGGVQLLLIGDLRQLAPVVKDAEWTHLSQHYQSPYFFESHALKKAGFLTVELQTIYRQQDKNFIALLNDIREGKGDHETLARLNAHYNPNSNSEDEREIRLTSHNHIADSINYRHLALIDSPTHSFKAEVSGKFHPSSFPADETLQLKEGARVMFIKNDQGSFRRFYNGMIGTVRAFNDDSVFVAPDEAPDTSIEVEKVLWENTSYRTNDETGDIEQTIEGTFRQIPLRLAWAITIHKSQGLTFERAMIDAQNAFSAGQLYVALSRCRSLEGMKLLTPIPPSAVIVDQNVNSFISQSRQNRPNESQIDYLKDEYCRSLLCELFNFSALGISLEQFVRCIKEYIAPIFGRHHLFEVYSEFEKKFAKEIQNVGMKFNQTYASCRFDSQAMLESESFRAKIANGCEYFLTQLNALSETLNNTDLSLDNKEYKKRMDRVAEELRFALFIKKYILKGVLADGFSPKTYMHHKAMAHLKFEEEDIRFRRAQIAAQAAKREKDAKSDNGVNGDKKTKGRKERAPKKPKGYSQMETLRLHQSGKSIEQIAEERGLAQSTISSHLGDMVAAGRIELKDLIPADTLSKIENYLSTRKSQKNPDDMADSTIFKILTSELSIPATHASIYSHATRTPRS